MNWAPQLSFAYSVYDSGEIQIGFSEGIGMPERYLSHNWYELVSGPDPATVTVDSGPVVYKLVVSGAPDVKLTPLVQMVKEDRIKIEGFEGWIESPSFTPQAKYYTR